MTRHIDVDMGYGAAAGQGLPYAPMAMPEQQLERGPVLRGLRLFLLPRLVWVRARVK